MMLRLFLGIILSALVACGAQAQTGTPKSKATLSAEISTCFPDNFLGLITPSVVRACVQDFLASWQQFTGSVLLTGTTHTVVNADYGQVVTPLSGAPTAITLPSAALGGAFYPFSFWVNVQGLGTTTITPSVGTINGQPNFVLSTNQYAFIYADGTNWQAINIRGSTININGGAAGTLAYYQNAGTTLSPLAPCLNGVFATTAGGVAQCVTTLPGSLIIPTVTLTGTVTGPNSGGTWGATGINNVPIGMNIATSAVFNNLGFAVLSPTSLENSPITVTGLTANNTPDVNNDYIPYFNAGDGLIRKITVGSVTSAGVAGVSNLNGLVSAVDLVGGNGITISPASPNIIIETPAQPPQGRLTLATGTPVMTASVVNATTIYYDCYHGGSVPVFNGTYDIELSIGSCEISTALQAAGSGVVNAAGVFDVWAINDSGALALCVATNGSGGGWASDTGGSNTARGTGYTMLNSTLRPYITNSNALPNCYNGATDKGPIQANRATYLGTFYSVNPGQTSHQYGIIQNSVATAVPGLFGLWNAYNRVSVSTGLNTGVGNYAFNLGGVWRQVNAETGMQVQYVMGLNEDVVTGNHSQLGIANPGGACLFSIGVDSITAPSTDASTAYSQVTVFSEIPSFYNGYPGAGLHTVTALETTIGAACTVANFGGVGQHYGGLFVNLRM